MYICIYLLKIYPQLCKIKLNVEKKKKILKPKM